MSYADLHMHSDYSDGDYSPAALAAMCKEKKLQYAALTDHDTMAGVGEFLDECRTFGIKAISGIEFSVEFSSELHILGYGFDPAEKGIKDACTMLDESRLKRARGIVANLCAHGYDIGLDEVLKAAGHGCVGRPHIADILIRHGYCKSRDDAFANFLQPGGPGDLKRERITAEWTINLIHNAGGKAVIAHPGLVKADMPSLISWLASIGIDGVEAFYPEHTSDQRDRLLSLAYRNGLFVTCGNDFHRHGRREIGGGSYSGTALESGLAKLFS